MAHAFMAFCNSKSPLAKARQVAWRALADHPIIAITRDSSIRLLAERFDAAGHPCRRPARFRR